MGCMIPKLSWLGGRQNRVGQDSVPYDSAELDSDPDFDSDEIDPNIQKPPIAAEFTCHQFTGGINSLRYTDMRSMHKLSSFIFVPATRFMNLYQQVLSSPDSGKAIVFLFSGLFSGWWLYVPVHELLHAAGCLLGGGEVHLLEIKTLYGGRILAHIFDFVKPAGDYAGRLSGFETHGSDWIYALTVFSPYVLSFFGFLFLDMAARRKNIFIFAFCLPLTFAPVISLTGDFFELGSLALFQVWPGSSEINRLMVSDDLFRLTEELKVGAEGVGLNFYSVSFMAISCALSVIFAWATLILSVAVSGSVVKYPRTEKR